MSLEMMAAERVCYVHCNFCNTILAVSVPCNNMFTLVTVRCGHCSNLLSVNMGASVQVLPPQDSQPGNKQQQVSGGDWSKDRGSSSSSSSSSSKCTKIASLDSSERDQHRIPPIRPPEKKQRVPSAYNRFIKEEIQRIKANNPDISHREAFSTAAKNWAHYPHIRCGQKVDGNKQTK